MGDLHVTSLRWAPPIPCPGDASAPRGRAGVGGSFRNRTRPPLAAVKAERAARGLALARHQRRMVTASPASHGATVKARAVQRLVV